MVSLLFSGHSIRKPLRPSARSRKYVWIAELLWMVEPLHISVCIRTPCERVLARLSVLDRGRLQEDGGATDLSAPINVLGRLRAACGAKGRTANSLPLGQRVPSQRRLCWLKRRGIDRGFKRGVPFGANFYGTTPFQHDGCLERVGSRHAAVRSRRAINCS